MSLRLLFAVCGISVVHSVGSAQKNKWSLETGDLVFQTSTSLQSTSILWATGSKYSHVGIIDMEDGRAQVIEAFQRVEATPIKDWVKRGKKSKFTILRPRHFNETERRQIVKSARSLIGRPYDPHFTFSNAAIYCSELIHLSYQMNGRSIGTVQKIRELNVNHPSVRKIAQQRWRTHPLCKTATDFLACWSRILDDDVISPQSIAEDQTLAFVFSNY